MTRAVPHTSGPAGLASGLVWAAPRRRLLPRRRPGPCLRLGDRQAHGPDAREGEVPLLLALAGGLLATDSVPAGTWAFAATLPDGRRWSWSAGIAPGAEEPVRPLPGAERHHPDDGTLRVALAEEAAVTRLAGVAVDGGDPRLPDAVRAALPDLDVRAVTPVTAGLPTLAAPARVPVPLAAALTSAAALLATAPAWAPMVASALRPPPPPPPATVAVGPDPAAFAPLCTAALEAWWPRIAGWRPVGSGCALAGHLPEPLPVPPPDGAGAPLVVWREALMAEDGNAVLAAAAAGRILETWPHGSLRTGDGLLLWQVRRIAPVRRPTDPDSADPGRAAPVLAAAFADAPDAVTRSRDGLTVRAPVGAALLLAGAAAADGLMPVRLDLPAGAPATLLLAPPPSRLVPERDAPPADGTEGGG